MQDANSDNSLPIWWHNIKFVLSGLMNPPPFSIPKGNPSPLLFVTLVRVRYIFKTGQLAANTIASRRHLYSNNLHVCTHFIF